MTGGLRTGLPGSGRGGGDSGSVTVAGDSLSSTSRMPGIGLTAWFLEFGPAVTPDVPVTSGPDSGSLLASMFYCAGRCA